MFWLKKLVSFWLMPLPLSVLLILVGLGVLRFTRWRRSGRVFAGMGVLWLIICSNSAIGTWMVRSLETRYPSQPILLETGAIPPSLARCTYIVVLGGGHGDAPERPANNRLSSSALSRIVEGVRIARQLPDAKLVVSGPADDVHQGPTHARMLADTAVSLGVDRSRIVEITHARDTEQEVIAVSALVGTAPVALVTSAWHLPRAMALCERAGLDALACPADYTARDSQILMTEFFMWNLSGLERSTKAVYETIGGWWSQLRGKA